MEILNMTTCAPERPITYVMPRVNIIEQPESVIIEAELPGVPKDGIHLEVKDNELTLVGKRAAANGEGRMHVQERAPVDYRRVFALSRAIDPTHVDAEMKDGLLKVTLHKREEVKPRKININ